MGVSREIIVVEDKLREMFDTLPATITSDGEFKPVFMYGDQRELNAFLKSGNDDPYPLIWLVYPYKEKHTRTDVELSGVSLVLAVETNISMFNMERMETTFKGVLFPLWDNIRELFNASNTIAVSQEYDIIKFPNYGEDGKSNESTDIWDALKITFDCSINNYCLKKILY